MRVILGSSRSLSLLDPLRPPMEASGRADELAVCLEGDAARGLDVFQLLYAGEVPIDQHRVGQRPQVLRRLQLWGVRRQEQQNSRCTCSGTRTLGLTCQPAPSSTSTICLLGPAPTAWANASSSTEKRSMLTVVARCHTVRPEAGCTKPTT